MPKPDQPRPVRRSSQVVRRSDGPVKRQHPRAVELSETPGPEQSASPGEVKLTVAFIERPHGVQGEFQASIVSDTPDHLLKLKSIFVGDEVTPRAIVSARAHQDRIVFKVTGINGPEQVRALSKTPLRIPGSAAAPLAEGEYFYYQLIDSSVVDESGAELGKLVDIMETGANQVYVVRGSDPKDELLLPNIPSVVLDIDVAAAKIVVRVPEYY